MADTSSQPPAMETIQQLLFAPYPPFALMAPALLEKSPHLCATMGEQTKVVPITYRLVVEHGHREFYNFVG